MDDRTLAAFWERFVRTPYGCLVWTGYYNPKTRYGSFTIQEDGGVKTHLAHRLAWTLLVGPIPKGLVVDHGNPERGCLNRGCGEPSHLELVTQAENLRRRVGHDDGAAYQRNKTHCPSGHAYDEKNTYLNKDGSRSCRTCSRDKAAARHAKARAENPLEPRVLKSSCKNGHEFTPENTRVNPKGARECRTCKRAQVAAYRARPKVVQFQSDACKNGHVYGEDNTYVDPTGNRSCRTCSKARTKEWYDRTRSKNARSTS